MLAETEIQHYIESPDSDGLLAMHWIGVLEEKARKYNLPGILGRALLLKARLQLLQRHDEEAQVALDK